jgi:hypothetical protein
MAQLTANFNASCAGVQALGVSIQLNHGWTWIQNRQKSLLRNQKVLMIGGLVCISVAQVGNLLYPPTGSRQNVGFSNTGGLPIRDTADCQSALLGLRLRRARSIRG